MLTNARHAVLAGCSMFGAMFLVEHIFRRFGVAPGETIWDDILIGGLTAGGAYLLLRHLDLARQVRRHRYFAQIIAQLNHHIRNALQVILSRADMSLHEMPEFAEISMAVNRIEWALREFLPQIDRDPEIDPDKPPHGIRP